MTIATRQYRWGCTSLALAAVALCGYPGGTALGQAAAPYEAPRVETAYLDELAKLPDWNGTWFIEDGVMFDPYNAHYVEDDPLTFGRGIGTGSYLTQIPLTPEYQEKYDQFIANSLEGKAEDPYGSCMQPHGMPRQMGGTPGGPEIIMLPGQVRMTWRHHNATRRIYTDGRANPQGDDLIPTYMGYSVGRWEGDMLIIETVGMLAGILDQSGAPVSEQVTTVERMKMVAPDVIYNEITITDPLALTEPWKVTRKYTRIDRDVAQEGMYCEGTRLDMSGGFQRVVLPGEEEGE